MSNHYSDYQKKAVSADDLAFDKIEDKDKAVISRIRKDELKKNCGFLIMLSIVLLGMLWMVISFIVSHATTIQLPNSPGNFFQFITLFFQAVIIFGCIYFLIDLIGVYRGIRRGAILTSSRINDGKVYLYVFDIYMEDKDESLMNFSVRKDTFEHSAPGDGVLILKTWRKIKVLPDPDRKHVTDVSNIRSGI